MLYVIIAALAILVAVLLILLVKQTERVRVLGIKVINLNDELVDLRDRLHNARGLAQLVRQLRTENEKLRRKNDHLEQEARDRVLSIELLASELDRTEKPARARKAPQDRRPPKRDRAVSRLI